MGLDVALMITAALFSIVSAVLSLINRSQILGMHQLMNSRLDQLVQTSIIAAEARGLKLGREEDRTDKRRS